MRSAPELELAGTLGVVARRRCRADTYRVSRRSHRRDADGRAPDDLHPTRPRTRPGQPERSDHAKELVESLGGTWKDCFVTIGGYDGIVVDFPDEAATTLMLANRGSVTTVPHPAFTPEEFRDIVESVPRGHYRFGTLVLRAPCWYPPARRPPRGRSRPEVRSP